MNVKIGELVEYVEGLNNASRRRANRMHGTINDLLVIQKELEEQADGDAQLIKTLELQLKVKDERVISCEKSFKEMETLWGKRDQNIMYWFKANNLSEDRANDLMEFLLKYQGE